VARRDPEEALLQVLRHPLRRQLLRRYLESEAADGVGPRELALAEKAPLSNVSYHVRVLAEKGAVELVRSEPSGGSVAHFYKAAPLVRETPWVLAALGMEGLSDGTP
jgi:DNA-binding transcriptional ArsR family regulator